ncbi:MAG: hypothetical protein Q7J35_13695 [Candidatus Methanoperedens sp.]|nr:hypothetical protein [Candidatus Methanoperedens sp.]
MLKVKLERFSVKPGYVKDKAGEVCFDWLSYLDMLKVKLERFSVKPGYVKDKAGYILAKQLKKQTWKLFG